MLVTVRAAKVIIHIIVFSLALLVQVRVLL